MTDNLTVYQITKKDHSTVETSSNMDLDNDKTVIAQSDPDTTIIHKPGETSQKVSTEGMTTVSVHSIINNRFVLEEILGVGGMGKVYKAIDLRKKEAHDKNPYVAIKVLNDEFRKHPESLIALQREARKSQQLSHPNIVNVYDFDRDGDIVYMTMELLQGRPLDEMINEEYPHGLPEEKATPIINAIANALLCAHQHSIIHSDLKPGNIFITDDNKAKIFDFGIARACQISQGKLDNDNEQNRTLFDPTELGALTPTYASLEMLEGKAPEPHDDIYSIACVFYELLTGKHPFNRLSADNAKKNSLKINKIASLDKSHLKTKYTAISKALAFEGKNRFDNVEAFIKDYNFKKKSKQPVLLSLVTSMILILVVFFPQIKEQYFFYQQTSFIKKFNTSTLLNIHHTEILNIHQHIKTLDPQTRTYVLENIKKQWLKLVQDRITNLDFISKKNNYNDVFKLLKISQVFYLDSAQVSSLEEFFEKKKYIEINRLNGQFNELLESLQFSQLSSSSLEQKQIIDLINRVKIIDSNHPLVRDQRLLLIFQVNIERLLTHYEIMEANKLLTQAHIIFPNDISLQDLADKTKLLEKTKLPERKTNYEQSLLSINPEEHASSQNLMQLKQKLSKLIEDQEMTDEWDKNVAIIFTQLNKKLGHRSLWFNEKKQTLASLYLKKSVSMRDKQRLAEARRLLEKSKQYSGEIFGIDDEEAILLALEKIIKVKHHARQRLAKINGLKISLATQLKAQEMTSAIRTYANLKRILGRSDPYISREAKHNIAQAYYHQARQTFALKHYKKTINIVKNGLKFEGHHSGLRSIRNKVLKQQKILINSKLLARQSLKRKTTEKK